MPAIAPKVTSPAEAVTVMEVRLSPSTIVPITMSPPDPAVETVSDSSLSVPVMFPVARSRAAAEDDSVRDVVSTASKTVLAKAAFAAEPAKVTDAASVIVSALVLAAAADTTNDAPAVVSTDKVLLVSWLTTVPEPMELMVVATLAPSAIVTLLTSVDEVSTSVSPPPAAVIVICSTLVNTGVRLPEVVIVTVSVSAPPSIESRVV